MFPQASDVIGIDLSPYMLAIGTFLLNEVGEEKINKKDDLISFRSNIEDVEVKEEIVVESRFMNSNVKSKFEWVDKIEKDERIKFLYGDMAETGIQSGKLLLLLLLLLLLSLYYYHNYSRYYCCCYSCYYHSYNYY